MPDLRNRQNRDESGRFQPGTAPGPGRPKGCPNDSTAMAKRLKSILVEHALEPDSEGKARVVAVLDTLAANDPSQYMAAVTRVLPREIHEQVTNPHLDLSPIVPIPRPSERFKALLDA